MVNDTGFYDGFTGSRGRILQFATGASLGSYIALKTIQPQSINLLERVSYLFTFDSKKRSVNLNLRER